MDVATQKRVAARYEAADKEAMGAFTGILSSLIGGGLKDIIGAVHLDPAKKAEIEAHLADLSAQAAQADRDLEAKLNEIAGQNIRQETGSNDAFVRRARPAFLWVMTGVLAFNITLPLLSQFCGGHLQPLPIDSGLYGLFSSGFLGYTIARSYEKSKGVQ